MANAIKIPADTLQQQFEASNPVNSSWLSANAGSGKTHVLTQRVIRLMLDGNAPDKIMCLTFTKAAAANMKNRVFETLATWTMMGDDELDAAIKQTTGKNSDALTRIAARQLFARALDTPGGLKIQTIHGFCESLLHQFPLEANVPGHFETVQELEQEEMLKRATADVLGGAAGVKPDIISHYEALIPYASDHAILEGIATIVSNRESFLRWYDRTPPQDAMEELYTLFGITPQDTKQSIQQDVLNNLPVSDADLQTIINAAQQGTGTSDNNLVQRLSLFLNSTDIDVRFEAIISACLTGSNEVRKEGGIATKVVKEQMPDLVPMLQTCGEYMISGMEKINAPELLKNSFHLFELGHSVLKRYQAMKQKRGIIDFNDQIERTVNLLMRDEIRDWIRYRLDQGVDHLLVDEAQDTSPAQWQIINAITDDFHSGENASGKNRTIFVVGDEKQSIFSFQGAEPQEFDRQRKRLKKIVEASTQQFHPGKLHLSFRSTKDILYAVDKVFGVEANRFGLTQQGEPTVHGSIRETHAGEVQIWPLYYKTDSDKVESWLDPVDHPSNSDPAVLLAERISGEIKQLVHKPLPGMDRPLAFKDILILVRSRDRVLISALTRKMKDDGLAVAGADRLKLTEHIAVEDMLAIGRAAILPQDDLSLACTLKSLFFNLSEEELFALSAERGKNIGLYERLIQIASDEAHPQRGLADKTLTQFHEIQQIALNHSVFEFYARLLGEFGGRRKILARLGSEAEDVLDAFIDEALNYTRQRDGSLEGFLSELTSADPEIKREVELNRDEVRILTVHASKGLEAPVVFLVDSSAQAWQERHRPALLKMPSDNEYKPFVWVPTKALHTSETREATHDLEIASEAEYRRLLYVGMTRAADRLILCGYRRAQKQATYHHWHNMVEDALREEASEILDKDGNVVGLRWVEGEKKPRLLNKEGQSKSDPARPDIPDWLFKTVKSEPPLPRPLSPSGASVLIDDDTSTKNGFRASGNLADSQFALQRGNVTHKLLEILPEIEPQERRQIAQAYLEKTCGDWNEGQKQSLLTSVFAILDAPEFSQLFAEQAKAEVSLAGWVDTKLGRLQISGQIDRLIISEKTVTILDYKTNVIVPQSAESVPVEYAVQLALYRELIQQIYPEHEIITALMWTQTPQIMILPDQLLNGVLHSFNKS